MEYNKSLSARIKRRNKFGFKGIGNNHFINSSLMGDYTDPKQNHKDTDYKTAKSRKDRVGMKRVINIYGAPFTIHKRALNKKYADNHQKATK